PGLDPCAAIQVHVDLDAGQSTEVHFFLGQEEDEASARSTVKRLRQPGALSQAWRATQDYWEDTLGSVRIRTPDARLDRLSNGWLLYQTIVSRFFGRTAFYQSSGAFGFRDQLQDCLAFLHTDPSLTRQQILLAARHQFTEGDVLHWWHPPSSAGVRTRCSDDLLWLVYVTAEYVHATGDADILQERVPFLTGPSLEEHEHVRYARFAVGPDETLLEHCRRAWSKGFTCGSHGLPLIGDGDWNDG